MSRRRQTAAGIERTLEKLERNVEAGNYYDAFQMYKSIYNRWMGERKLEDSLKLLISGCTLFLSHNQENSGTELSVLLGDHLINNNIHPTGELTDILIKIIKSFEKSSEGRQRFIVKVFKWSKLYTEHGDPNIHRACAEVYFTELDYATCCTHCLYLGLDGVQFYSQTLIEVSRVHAYKSELGLIITWAVLQFLSMKRTEHARRIFRAYTAQHPAITTTFPYTEPLLNYIQFIIQAIDRRSPDLVKLLNVKYQKCLQRDPYFNECIDKILLVYFNEQKTSDMGLEGLGGIMQSLLGGMMEPEPGTSASASIPAAVRDCDEDLD